jgi:hypothetical protein
MALLLLNWQLHNVISRMNNATHCISVDCGIETWFLHHFHSLQRLLN